MKTVLSAGALIFFLLNVVVADTNMTINGSAPLPSEQSHMEHAVTPPARPALALERQLEPNQRAQFRAAIETDRAKLNVLNEQLRGARAEMLAAQLAEKFDEADFRAKSEAVGKIQTEIDVLGARAFAKIRPSLTAEQIQKMTNPPVPIHSPAP